MGTFFYVLLAFIVGLLLGWFLWGRLRGECDRLHDDLENARGERDLLKTDRDRLSRDLDACGNARVDLERQLGEVNAARGNIAKTAPSPALTLVPPPQVSSAPAATKSANVMVKGPEPDRRKAANSTVRDNLRRLIGIGPVNERRLNEHGITTFAQIAGWSATDVRSVEEYLQFDGRIKRERWVEQAKLLAAGNEKEFARRFPTAGSSNNT